MGVTGASTRPGDGMTDQDRFETLAREGADATEVTRLAAAVRGGETGAARDLAAVWMHGAAAAPGRLAQIYDAAALGWLGRAPKASVMSCALEPGPIPATFWGPFWEMVLAPPGAGPDALAVTQQTAALAGGLDAGFRDLAVSAALTYPGVAEAAAQGFPERFTLDELALAPKGSLGAAFHSLIVDNGFDLEVLDRDALGLADLPPPLDYLNARILQCHDLWHILAGYQTTGLHEVAISGFQAGQFGHNYSAMFLGMVLTKMSFSDAPVLPMMLDIILSAWTHGRESPSLLGLDWPAVWGKIVEDLRTEIGLVAYASPYPADLFEQLRAA